MDIDMLHDSRPSNTIRSFNGCWTCRLRRKKCDERRLVCDVCAYLRITCHYSDEKPCWMDGGEKQEEMAERLKREVKENAPRRYGERPISTTGISVTESITGEWIVLPRKPPGDQNQDSHIDGTETLPDAPTTQPQHKPDCGLNKEYLDRNEVWQWGKSDTILLMFYLEHLFPFMYPFYRPALLLGGRAWMLDMMINSPVVRRATLCQSSYFFSLARGSVNHNDEIWETVLGQTRNTFEVLRDALQCLEGTDIADHMHGAARVMTSILQVQRFEITVSSFNNCHAHLNAAVAVFRQLLGAVESDGPSSSFKIILKRLGVSPWVVPSQCPDVPSAEQAGFRFSSALLIFDDIIASTALQEEPRLHEYHHSLLCNVEGTGPHIDLEATVGCQNWALLQIGEIAVLDAWKRRCKGAGNFDAMELVHRATAIKGALESHLKWLENEPVNSSKERNGLLDVFIADYGPQAKVPNCQTPLVTRVWAHAALLYLSVVVSGWQPVSADVRYHVGRIIELLTREISPPALLRAMVWPFCVAGCLAEQAQEPQLRAMVEALQPPSAFGTVRKALGIMESAWRSRCAGDNTNRDLATFFRSQGDLVLLV